MQEFKCPLCGMGTVEDCGNEIYRCKHCGNSFRDEFVQSEIEKVKSALGSLFSEQKQEDIANARYNLWSAAHEEYTDSEKILGCCRELKKFLPKDFQANFYEVANGGTVQQLNAFLDGIDVKKNASFLPDVIAFTLKSLETPTVSPLKDLITRAYTGEQYLEYMTRVEDEAQKSDEGMYHANVPRDVFLAYSSADMGAVNAVCALLEDEGFSCFVALRNLRHGRGAVQNYQKELETAIKNCKCVVFLSSENSRSLSCDALKIELPYIKEHCPNMGRVEYVIEEYGAKTKRAAQSVLKGFFEGLEWCRSEDDLIDRVVEAVTKQHKPEEKESETARLLREQQEQIKRLEVMLKANAPVTDKPNEESVREKSIAISKQSEEVDPKDMAAQFNLALKYLNGDGVKQDYAEAVKWYKKAAEQGHMSAQCGLGNRYYYGQGVKQDYAEAAKWYRKAAEQGDADSQNNLGDCYRYGLGVNKDFVEAVKWYKKAAEQGSSYAQNKLGSCYYNGQGVKQDFAEAVKWYSKSAEQGNKWAQHNLGACYELGRGVPKNISEAVAWYEKSAEQGLESAKNALQRIR